MQAWSVTELNTYVGSLLTRDPLLRQLRVQGELSGFKRHSSGHLYFSLKDEGAVVRCVMFRKEAASLTFQPQDGMRVTLAGHAALYGRDGQYQLYAQSLEQEGEGELYRRFLMLKTRLAAEGYFNAERKRPLPKLPRWVGVVTSPTGAAIEDIRNIISRRYPGMHILLAPVLVQGEGAAEEIAAGIRAMNRDGRPDVLIVGRGGGSLEDLFAFNELVVAKAIYESAIPVVSAVGHETDFTIADFIADLRAPTPSAAAELAVPEYAGLMEDLQKLLLALDRSMGRGLQEKRQRLQLMKSAGAFALLPHMLCARREALENAMLALRRAAAGGLQEARNARAAWAGRLEALGPEAVLKRGFALVEGEDGAALDGVGRLSPGARVALCFHDGQAEAKIETIALL